MESELGRELLEQIVDSLGEAAEESFVARPAKSRAYAGTRKGVRRLQAWHCLILVFAAFWVLFAVILLASGFYFLVVALAVLALLSSLVIGLAWAFQNDI